MSRQNPVIWHRRLFCCFFTKKTFISGHRSRFLNGLQSHHLGIETHIFEKIESGELELQSHHLGIETEKENRPIIKRNLLQSHHLGIETDAKKIVWRKNFQYSNRTI